MPMKLNVGLSKKLGLADYDSLGVSCHLELELDQSLIVSDPDGFQERVRRTFTACRQAVDDELARRSSVATNPSIELVQSASTPVNGAYGTSANGHRPARGNCFTSAAALCPRPVRRRSRSGEFANRDGSCLAANIHQVPTECCRPMYCRNDPGS